MSQFQYYNIIRYITKGFIWEFYAHRTIKVEKYVASDGKVFEDRLECEEYEKYALAKTEYEKIKHLRVSELDDLIPLNFDASYSEWSHYEWYKVENDSQLDAIETYYDVSISSQNYPTYICVETEDDERNGTPYVTTLQDCIDISKAFFDRFI